MPTDEPDVAETAWRKFPLFVVFDLDGTRCVLIYRAMLAASPAPPEEGA